MIHAYDENLLYKAQTTLAFMFDTGVNVYNVDVSRLYQLFLVSGMAERFARGDVKTLAGQSGTEMAYELISLLFPQIDIKESLYNNVRTREYWLGWVLAYYQWYRGISFTTITEKLPIQHICDMYDKYHEMDMQHFAEAMDTILFDKNDSALRRYRKYLGISQKDLSLRTGIPVRTLQQYEQGQKNINHARMDYVVSLSKALQCRVEDLMNLE